MVLPITKVIKRVVAGQASLLQIPMMEIRFAADSIGPRIVTYGFTDAWSTALAAPQMNEAKRNHTIDSVAAAWMNSPKAIAKMMNERAIVFLVTDGFNTFGGRYAKNLGMEQTWRQAEDWILKPTFPLTVLIPASGKS